MATEAKQIREQIKKTTGLSSRQFGCSYKDGVITGSIKDFSEPAKIKKAVDFVIGAESIDRCQYSGEILLGGNTYTRIEADRKKFIASFCNYEEVKQAIISAYQNEGTAYSAGEGFRVTFPVDREIRGFDAITVLTPDQNSERIYFSERESSYEEIAFEIWKLQNGIEKAQLTIS